MEGSFGSYEEKARHILSHNMYMVVATSDKEAKPWGAVVFYANDESGNFYFISAIDSLHARNMQENPNVSLVIYDSTQQLGLNQEVQVYGNASIVNDGELKGALEFYTNKLFSISNELDKQEYDPSQYSEPAEFRVFKIVPVKIYTTTEDRRTEVNLSGK